jgi:hypothetical protein
VKIADATVAKSLFRTGRLLGDIFVLLLLLLLLLQPN